MTGTAVFSDDQLGPDGTPRYRYALTRQLNRHAALGRVMLLVMLNPSTATAIEDDPTIRRCIGFARREKCANLAVANLYAYRSPSPKLLQRAARSGVDIVGPANDTALRQLARRAEIVVAAWGAIGRERRQRADDVLRTLIAARDDDPNLDPAIYCLGITANGSPRHPLYVRADQPLVPYVDWTPEGSVR